MNNATIQNLPISSGVNDSKVTKHLGQFQKVFNLFRKEYFSIDVVLFRYNINRDNICWYCRKLRHQNQIKPVRKGIGSVTSHRATYWTTNPAFFPQPKQLNLFEQ